MNRTDKFVTVDPDSWFADNVSSKVNFSLLTSIKEEDTPTL